MLEGKRVVGELWPKYQRFICKQKEEDTDSTKDPTKGEDADLRLFFGSRSNWRWESRIPDPTRDEDPEENDKKLKKN